MLEHPKMQWVDNATGIQFYHILSHFHTESQGKPCEMTLQRTRDENPNWFAFHLDRTVLAPCLRTPMPQSGWVCLKRPSVVECRHVDSWAIGEVGRYLGYLGMLRDG